MQIVDVVKRMVIAGVLHLTKLGGFWIGWNSFDVTGPGEVNGEGSEAEQ